MAIKETLSWVKVCHTVNKYGLYSFIIGDLFTLGTCCNFYFF